MPRAPSQIGFICESCDRPATVRQMRRWVGECRHCRGRSWTLYANYTDTEVETSVAGLAAAMTIGIGWQTVRTSTNQTMVHGVAARVVQWLTEDRSLVAARVVAYIRMREQQALRDRGAQSCKVCDIIYMPAQDKPWTLAGYCSKSCAARGDLETPPIFQEVGEKHQEVPTMMVTCPNGHTFYVPASFSGCLRKCTYCGAKTPVP